MTSSRYRAPAQPVSALAESLGADFSDEGERYRYRDVLSGLFATWFADHTAEEITEALSATSVLFERYRTFAQVAEDERVTANPLFSRLHQDGLGDYLAPGCRPSSTVSHVAGEPAPRLGGDTAGVLTAPSGIERSRHHATDQCENDRLLRQGDRRRMTKLAQTIGLYRISEPRSSLR